jgi:hypothetical protein
MTECISPGASVGGTTVRHVHPAGTVIDSTGQGGGDQVPTQ